jgi:hypothetical protein
MEREVQNKDKRKRPVMNIQGSEQRLMKRLTLGIIKVKNESKRERNNSLR